MKLAGFVFTDVIPTSRLFIFPKKSEEVVQSKEKAIIFVLHVMYGEFYTKSEFT